MDNQIFSLLKVRKISNKTILLFTFLYSLFSLVFSQLSRNDINYIQKTILSDQDETTGVFGKSYLTTYKSIKILEILKINIPNQSKICRDLGYETKNPVKLEYVELNDLLDCKNEFTNLEELKIENLHNLNLSSLYEKLIVLNKLKLTIDWKDIFDNILLFKDEDELFSNQKNGKTNLSNTVQALHLLIIIYKDNNLSEELKDTIKNQTSNTFINMYKEFQLLREVNKLFSLCL